MMFEDCEYIFLIEKYNKLSFKRKQIEERLKMIDPYVSINLLELNLEFPYFL